MKSLSLAAAFAAACSVAAAAAPVGLDLMLETGADNLFGEGNVEIYTQPELEYAVGDTGLRLGLSWEVPLAPAVEVGKLEGVQELELVLPWLVLTLGNNDELALDSFDLEGYLYAVAERGLGPVAVSLEVDVRYLPAFAVYEAPHSPGEDKVWAVQAIAGAAWETELGPGTLGVGIEQNLPLYDRWELGDTELTVSYEAAVRGVGITVEVEPILSVDATVSVSTRLILRKSL